MFRTCLILALMLFASISFGQTVTGYNEKGQRQGVVRIKVAKTTATTLKNARLRVKNGAVQTGISSLDAVSSQYKATQLKRLFPENPNPKLEAKLRKHGLDLWYEVKVDPSEDINEVVNHYRDLGEVTIAETERLKVLSTGTPVEVNTKPSSAMANETMPFNDPYLTDQWHYSNTGQSGYSGIDVNLFEAWSVTAGSSQVIVSVHDEGVDVNHDDLKDNIWINEAELNGTPGVDDDGNGYIDDINGWNFSSNSGAMDPDPHGTHVAGTVAAVNNNGIGVSGVAGGTGNNDGAKIMSMKILGGESGSAANSYIYAANNGAVISQNSWGYIYAGSTEAAVRDAINYFIQEAGDYPGSPMKGGIVIFAAGNSDRDDQWYPGFYPEAFTVSSLGPEGYKAGYSNYGTWVDITAPGGDMAGYGSANGVLSTLPNNKIGYLDGTSMACPHVSGIAALALANANQQLTPAELQNKLLTGVKNIDHLNPNYLGKLGQLTDAFLAIQNDAGLAPATITDLQIDGIAQEFATLSWTVPADADDSTPIKFNLYYGTEAITSDNFHTAQKIELTNELVAGERMTYSVNDLYGLTTYYFSIVAVDRWGNTSILSNVVSDTTNAGPQINVDENSKNITVDINAINSTTGTHDISLLNEAEGILRWEYEARHRNTTLAYTSSLGKPLGKPKASSNANVAMKSVPGSKSASNTIPSPLSFERTSMEYYSYVSNIIGEEDTTVPNSAATKFVVNNPDGFNLTEVSTYIKIDPAKGALLMEIYKGEQLSRENVVYTQEYSPYSNEEGWAYINLNEQLYFNNDETFWVVFHAPSGNLFPFGVGPKKNPNDDSQNNCFMSFDGGASWGSLPDLISSQDFVWAAKVTSGFEHLGEYLSLSPDSGEVLGNGQSSTTLTADASTLINGTYNANVILKSNDGKQPELRLPVTLNVSGQQPVLSAVSELNFGSVFQGKSEELTFELTNLGLGNYGDITISSSSDQFEMTSYAPWRISAKNSTNITIKYTPSATSGNDNGILTISSASSAVSHTVYLFGVSTEPGKIKVTPTEQSVDDITIGDPVSASITIENQGASVLKYFIPGFDTKGISDSWEEQYSEAGYKFRSNHNGEQSPISYDYEDISSTGENITQYFKDKGTVYKAVDMGFKFPYYEQQDLSTLYVSSRGFTTFSDEFNPINDPSLGADLGPQGYISVLGYNYDLAQSGAIYYEVRPDRVIIQYDDLGYSWTGYISAQMVLHKNGNIRFYYSKVEMGEFDLNYINVLIEDFDKSEGILYNNFSLRNPIYTGMAIGYDYPGPNIITSITNGSGVLMPGQSASLDIEMATDILNEGTTNRYLNIISNDPVNSQTIALVKLNVTEGGVSDVALSTESIDFGDVFQGAVATNKFVLINNGSAATSLTSFVQDTNAFTITGEKNGELSASSILSFEVTLPTDTIGVFSDMVTVTTDEGATFQVSLTGNVIDPPAISINLDPITQSLNYGEKASREFTIENTGLANLELVATGNQWLSLGSNMAATSTIPNFTYSVESFNDGENYNWLDIRKSGTQLPHITDIFNPDEYYRTLTLSSPIQFYGNTYNTIYLAENGAIYFEKPNDILINGDGIPSSYSNKMIAPYWAFGGFNTYFHDPADVGLFYTEDENKTVISWEYLVDNFGIGDPISAQIIFYKNGTMKFQYKVNGGFDFLSAHTVIGIQDLDVSDSVLISNRGSLNHGSGLAYVLTPAEKQIIAPGETLSTYINFDAGTVFAGTYQDALKFRTNVPNQETLKKDVTLTVIGDAQLTPSVNTLEYGDIMAYTTEEGPKSYIREFDLSNTGVANLDLFGLTIAQNAIDYTIEMYTYDSWFGSWYWQNVNFIWQWPSLVPSESAKFRVTFTPQTPGVVDNEIVVSSSVGDVHIPVTANVTLPPVFEVEVTEVFSSISDLEGTDSQTAKFNNTNGQGELHLEFSLDYLRAPIETASSTSIESMASFTNNKKIALHKAKVSTVNSDLTTYNTYNRTLAHDSNDSPDTFIGFGGVAELVAATRFNAGSEGFNLSHVQTFVKADELLTGTLTYEIRAGGNSIADAVVLGKGSYDYTITDGTEGQITIPLDRTYAIYPNEDFYVVIGYPFELHYPQGVVTGLETVLGRFVAQEGDEWFDLQEVYPDNGWMMRALEEAHDTSAWVKLQDSGSNIVNAGDSKVLNLDFFASSAERGHQHAALVVKSNDPYNSIERVPVKLHINELPSIADNPQVILVNEGETTMQELLIEDPEKEDVTVVLSNTPMWLSYSVENNILKLTMAPGYEDEGVYQVEAVITDLHNASSQEVLNIEVMHVNRAPDALDTEDLSYEGINIYDNLSFANFFSDPESDEMTFTAVIADATIANTFVSNSSFVLHTLKEGVTTLELTATDTHGATSNTIINVVVEQRLGTDEVNAIDLQLYPNPVSNILNISAKVVIDAIEVFNINGQLLLKETLDVKSGSTTLDVSNLENGVYFLRAYSSKGITNFKFVKE